MLSLEDKHCCHQLFSVWHFVTATTGNQQEDRSQSAHFAKCTTRRLRWDSVQSRLTRPRFVTREQTVVSGPATGHRASHLKPDYQGRFQSQPKCVRFYTFNMCHLLYFNQIVKKKKKDMLKRERTRDMTTVTNATLFGGIGTWRSRARVSLSLCRTCQAAHGGSEWTTVPGHATHLPKEVGHQHVWEGLGPPGDLRGTKPLRLESGRSQQ